MAAVSKVQICNLALSALGSKAKIQALTEESKEAQACNLHYTPALRTILEDVDWSFCSATATSALSSDDPPDDWTYMYAEPANSAKVREIVNELGRTRDPIPFARHIHNGQRMLLTDWEAPTWRYTLENDDPTTYSGAFVEAFKYLLAANIAMELTRKPEIAEAMSKQYRLAKQNANTNDANEIHENGEPEKTIEWIDIRA